MRVNKNRLLLSAVSLVAILTYAFPMSNYIRFMIVALAALSALLYHVIKKKRISSFYVFTYTAFVTWAAMSYLWTLSAKGYREQIFHMAVAISINIFVATYSSAQEETFETMMRWVLPVMTIYLLESIMVGHFNSSGRFSASGAVNQFGISSSYIFLITIFLFKRKKLDRLHTWWIIGLMVVSGGLTLLSGSRKALINLALFLVLVLLFEYNDKNIFKKLRNILGIAIIVAIVLFLILKVDFLYRLIGNRFESLLSYYQGDVGEDLSALRRDNMKNDAFALFSRHPVLGIGLNAFKYTARYGTYAHSDLYELSCCLGAVGFILYYLPVVVLFIMAFNQWRRNLPNAILPLAITLSFLINEFSNISYIYGIIHIFLGLAAGMVFINQRDSAAVQKLSDAQPKKTYRLRLRFKRAR